MKNGKKLTSIVLLTALAFATGWMLPGAGEAIDTHDPHEEWLITPESAIRTEAGECTSSLKPICRELCLNSEPQGDFMCFVG